MVKSATNGRNELELLWYVIICRFLVLSVILLLRFAVSFK